MMNKSATLNPLEEAKKLYKQGRLKDAAFAYKRVVDSDNENVDALFGWAYVAFDRGNIENAERLLLRALQIAPDHVGALIKLSTIYTEKGWYGKARQCCNKALDVEPDCMDAFNNLAITYIVNHEFWDAERIAHEGLANDKDCGMLYQILGYSKLMQGHANEAISNYKKAIKLLPPEKKARAFRGIGVVYADIGDRGNAERFFEKAIGFTPEDAEAHYAYGSVHKYELNDAHIDSMKLLLSKVEQTSLDAVYLNFALGKAYDQIGDYDQAFTHYAQGNFVWRATFEYSTEFAKEIFSKIKKTFKKGFEASQLKPRKSDPTPIFIVGIPRSGTTLTEQILQSHPQVEAAGETSYLDDIQGKHHFGDDITKIPSEVLRSIRDDYLVRLKQHAPKGVFITDKMPMNFRLIGLIRLLFPQAKVIHCRRDPMDTCFSIYKCLFNSFFPFAYDLKELGRYYKHYEDLMAFWHKALPGFVYDVQYEDLISDQEHVSRGIVDFCSLPWDPKCLEFHKSDRPVLTASALQVKKPLYKSAIGSWRKYEKHLGLLKKELE